MPDFRSEDYWKALILYGLNQATYKIALGKTLLQLSNKGYTRVSWQVLSEEFFRQYQRRLTESEAMPQQSNPARQTRMEQIVSAHTVGQMDTDQAISEVGATAFGDVIARFHNLGSLNDVQGKFYRYQFGKELQLTDELHRIAAADAPQLEAELDARWSMLEGAFSIQAGNYQLANDVRLIYLEHGYKRKDLSPNIPFLQGYQGNVCFYCGQSVLPGDIHVDHVLPRQVLHHDELWNLVLAHSFCNEQKSDRLVGEHFIAKLIARNENIVGSNHPWRKKIIQALGKTPAARASSLRKHYDRVRTVLGPYYWGGALGYNPATDPFYSRLITVLNNSRA